MVCAYVPRFHQPNTKTTMVAMQAATLTDWPVLRWDRVWDRSAIIEPSQHELSGPAMGSCVAGAVRWSDHSPVARATGVPACLQQRMCDSWNSGAERQHDQGCFEKGHCDICLKR